MMCCISSPFFFFLGPAPGGWGGGVSFISLHNPLVISMFSLQKCVLRRAYITRISYLLKPCNRKKPKTKKGTKSLLSDHVHLFNSICGVKLLFM